MEKKYWPIVRFILILGAIAFAVGFCLDLTGIGWEWSLIWGTFAALLTVSSRVDKFFLVVRANHAAVLGNWLRRGSSKSEDRNSIDPSDLRPVFSGVNFIVPWEYVIGTYDLGRKMELGDDLTVVGVGDKQKWVVTWQVALRVLKSHVCNLAVNGEEAGKIYFTDKFKQEIFLLFSEQHLEKGTMVDNTGEYLSKNIPMVRDRIENLFWGDATIHPDEERFGLLTSNATIPSILREKSAQDAAEATSIATQLAQAVTAFKQAAPDATDSEALAAVLATLEGAKVDVLHLVGIPQGLKGSFNLGDIRGNTGGGGGKKPK